MPPTLEPVFTLRGYIDQANVLSLESIKNGPSRTIAAFSHGFIKGSGLDAEILPGGADWLLFDASTKTSHLNVRLQARTSTGHGVYIHYKGVLKIDDKAAKALTGSPDAVSTNFGDHDWFAAPIMETDDPALKWVESSMFLAEGRFVVEDEGKGMEYLIYKVSN